MRIWCGVVFLGEEFRLKSERSFIFVFIIFDLPVEHCEWTKVQPIICDTVEKDWNISRASWKHFSSFQLPTEYVNIYKYV